MLGFRMVASIAIAIAIAIDIYGTDHSKTEHPNTELENVRFSNGFGFRMVGIRALTVLLYCLGLNGVLVSQML